MNQRVKDIYEEYRDEMTETLGLEEMTPEKFGDPMFVQDFETKVERLDTLIALYAELISANKNR
jgi:hypothetical protein